MTSTSAPTRRPAPSSWSGANERRTAFLKYPCPISQAFIPDYPLFADQSSQSMLHTERWHPADSAPTILLRTRGDTIMREVRTIPLLKIYYL